MVRLEVIIVAVDGHCGCPFARSAAPVAAFMATKAAGGTELHP